jgi:hypothetical protein
LLDKPVLTTGQVLALQAAKLTDWYGKNEKAIYSLVLVVYNDFYNIQPTVLKAVYSRLLSEAVRNGLGYYFEAGISSLGVHPRSENGYSRGLQDHFNDVQLTKNFNWQMYQGRSLPNQDKTEALLQDFYDYIIVRAIERGIDSDRTNPQSLNKAELLANKVNKREIDLERL